MMDGGMGDSPVTVRWRETTGLQEEAWSWVTALSAVILGQFRTVLFGVARESGGSAWFLVGEDTISGLRGADDTRYLTAGARGTGWGSESEARKGGRHRYATCGG